MKTLELVFLFRHRQMESPVLDSPAAFPQAIFPFQLDFPSGKKPNLITPSRPTERPRIRHHRNLAHLT